jgi:hypothetical protein
MMNNPAIPQDAAQKRAGRIGTCVAIVVTALACLCLLAVWGLFVSNDLGILKTSWHLQNNGEVTSGTIVDYEMHDGVKPGDAPTRNLIVEYTVDGETYTVKTYSAYAASSEQERGDSIDVIYDPADPATAQVDIFSERWFMPFISILPF